MKGSLRKLSFTVFYLLLSAFLVNRVYAGGLSVRLENGMGLSGSLIVNGETLSSPAPYASETDGTVMVPLRAAAEALGMSVEWRDIDKSVIIGDRIKITAGKRARRWCLSKRSVSK